VLEAIEKEKGLRDEKETIESWEDPNLLVEGATAENQGTRDRVTSKHIVGRMTWFPKISEGKKTHR